MKYILIGFYFCYETENILWYSFSYEFFGKQFLLYDTSDTKIFLFFYGSVFLFSNCTNFVWQLYIFVKITS